MWRRDRWLEEFPAGLTRIRSPMSMSKSDGRGCERTSPSPHPVRPRGYNGFNDVRWQSLFEGSDVTGALSHSEMRHPFLDLRLLQFMLALPPMPWCRNKLIIRRSMRTALPRDVLLPEEIEPSGQSRLQAGRQVWIPPVAAVAESIEVREPG